MRFTFRLLAAVAVVAGLVGSASAAPIVIDSFNGGTYSAGPGSPKNQLGPTQALVADVTGTRTVFHSSPDISSNFAVNEGVNLNTGNAVGGMSLSAFDAGVLVGLNYNFGGTIDIDSDGLEIDFDLIDNGIGNDPFPLTIRANNDPTLEFTFNLNDLLGFNTLQFVQAAWQNIPISSLQFFFNDKSNPAADFRVLEIRVRDGTFTPFETVPEPASMVVFGVLALGGAFVARRKLLAKKAAVA